MMSTQIEGEDLHQVKIDMIEIDRIAISLKHHTVVLGRREARMLGFALIAMTEKIDADH